MKRDPELDLTSNQERGAETPSKRGLIHLAICLGTTVAVIIAVNLVGRLA